jgi:hypothetical protein
VLRRLEEQRMLMHTALFDEDSQYSKNVDLFSKHRVLQEVISEDFVTAFHALQFLKALESFFQTQM